MRWKINAGTPSMRWCRDFWCFIMSLMKSTESTGDPFGLESVDQQGSPSAPPNLRPRCSLRKEWVGWCSICSDAARNLPDTGLSAGLGLSLCPPGGAEGCVRASLTTTRLLSVTQSDHTSAAQTKMKNWDVTWAFTSSLQWKTAARCLKESFISLINMWKGHWAEL